MNAHQLQGVLLIKWNTLC